MLPGKLKHSQREEKKVSTMNSRLTFIDLFAGIGGFRRGMELAGHKCMGFCEWDKFATASYTSMHLITDEQRQKLAGMSLKERQKEILKDEYRNGEWYSPDIRQVGAGNVPRVDCWCFGAPCQDFSIAGKRAGLDGDRSSLIREVFRILGELEEKDRPEWLIYENVKGMLSSNKGNDFLSIVLAMEKLGYDISWQVFNSKYHGVPQNRERVYTLGHLRRYGERKVFPLCGTDGEDNICKVKQIAQKNSAHRKNLNQYRVYDSKGLSPCLNKMDGGGREPHIPMCIDPQVRTSKQVQPSDTAPTLRAQAHGNNPEICIPVLTPDRTEKRQNGRRFKDNGEEVFTLTAQDRHGVAISEVNGVPVIWYEKYKCYIAIRKLTPKECFRLQGWTDDYFEKAQFVNSDSQLYKQAGNGVTVNVVEDIARAIGECK